MTAVSQQMFEKEYSLPEGLIANSVCTAGDGFIISVYHYSTNLSGLIKVDEHGDTLWTKKYLADAIISSSNVVAMDDQHCLLLNGAAYDSITWGVEAKMVNNSGNVIWSRLYTALSNYGESSLLASDGNIYLVSDKQFAIAIAKLNISGDLIWNRRITGTGGSVAHGSDAQVPRWMSTTWSSY